MGETVHTDVAVVGSGGAALVAALAAAVGGARVTVIERAPRYGGTTAISGGGMWLPNNGLDPENRHGDNLEDARRYLDKLTMGMVREETLSGFLEGAPQVVKFMREFTGLDLYPDLERPDYHADYPGAKLAGRTVGVGEFDTARLGEWAETLQRPHWPGGTLPIRYDEMEQFVRSGNPLGWVELAKKRMAEGIVLRGCALIAGLMEACLARGVRVLLNTRARSLVIDDGAVTGVRVERDGATVTIQAPRGVVLACGGFEWNRRLWDELIGVPYDGPLSPPYNEGDGLRMAMAAGARVGNLNGVWWMPSRWIGDEYEGHPRLRTGGSGQIIVNSSGRRFGNETLNYNDFGKILSHFDPNRYVFPNSPAYAISDRSVRVNVALDHETPGGLTYDSTGDPVVEAPTLRELAEKLGIDPDGLEAEVKRYNEFCESGVDEDFHRGESAWERDYRNYHSKQKNPALEPFRNGPYYGFRVRAGCFGTKGGPIIDGHGRVLDFDDQPIPGLYAAGNVAASAFGPAYPGGGATLGLALVFGYRAGVHVATR